MHSTVGAVILTFNALSRIRQCLAAVVQQTRLPDKILVVDNHSHDGTSEYLESLRGSVPHLMVVRTAENLGPAGGFHLGMSMIFESGCKYLWLLDDDSVADANCLEILLNQLGTLKNAIAWPLNIDETGRTSTYTAWRGELIPREVIEQGGFPNKDLFWGVEDTEYFGRLHSRHHIGRIIAREALVHYTRSNLRKNATWHYYYRSRNMVYYRLWVQQPPRIRKLFFRLLRLWARAVLTEENKIKKTFYMLKGIIDGLRRRIGKTMEPAD